MKRVLLNGSYLVTVTDAEYKQLNQMQEEEIKAPYDTIDEKRVELDEYCDQLFAKYHAKKRVKTIAGAFGSL